MQITLSYEKLDDLFCRYLITIAYILFFCEILASLGESAPSGLFPNRHGIDGLWSTDCSGMIRIDQMIVSCC